MSEQVMEDIYCMAVGGVPYGEIATMYNSSSERVANIVKERKGKDLYYPMEFDKCIEKHTNKMKKVLQSKKPTQ